MNMLLLANAFGAGMLGALNPCAFAMLPSFLAFYLGAREPGYAPGPLGQRLLQVLAISGLVTAGFLTIFVVGGAIISRGLGMLFDWTPYLMIPVALTLMVLGVAQLRGHVVQVSWVQPGWSEQGRGPRAMYLYGVGYALASLSCMLPVFLAVIGSAAAVGGLLTILMIFVAYGLGMGTVILGVGIGAALFQGAVARWVRPLLPYVRVVSGVFLVAAGLYLIGYMAYYFWGFGRPGSMLMSG